MFDFIYTWTFMIAMAILLVILIGVLYMIRNRREED